MKAKCLDCGSQKEYISRADTWRAARPYCRKCGSRRLEPIVKEKKPLLKADNATEVRPEAG